MAHVHVKKLAQAAVNEPSEGANEHRTIALRRTFVFVRFRLKTKKTAGKKEGMKKRGSRSYG